MAPEFDWNDLRAFLAVARDGRLTAAARRLRIDHSTLSRRLSGLEAALQTRLFERHASGYVPTAAGERLMAEAEAIESRAVTIRSLVSDRAPDVGGSVRIGSPEGFGTVFLSRRIGSMTARHPALDIELVANPRAVSLPKREADIVISNFQPVEGRLHARKLTDYELGLYASPAYLEQVGPITSVQGISAYDFIGYIDDYLPTPQHAYLQSLAGGIVPRNKASDVISQHAMTVAGVGLCVLPCFMVSGDTANVGGNATLVRLLPDFRLTRSYWLVVNSDMRDIGRVRATTTFIAEACRSARACFLPSSILDHGVTGI